MQQNNESRGRVYSKKKKRESARSEKFIWSKLIRKMKTRSLQNTMSSKNSARDFISTYQEITYL